MKMNKDKDFQEELCLMNTPCAYKQEAKTSLYPVADSPSSFLSAHGNLTPFGPGSSCRLQEFRTTCSFSGFAPAIPSIYSAIPVSITCPVLKPPSWLKSCHLFYEDFPILEGVNMYLLFTTLEIYPMEESTLVARQFL